MRNVRGPSRPGLDGWAEWAVRTLGAEVHKTWSIGSLCSGLGMDVMVVDALNKALYDRGAHGNVRHVFQAELDKEKRSYLLEQLGLNDSRAHAHDANVVCLGSYH